MTSSTPVRLVAVGFAVLCCALPLHASGPQTNFTARPEADPFGNIDVKWASRRGGLYDFQYTDSLAVQEWTSLFKAYAAETADMAVRVWNAPPVADGPPAPAPALAREFAITMIRNGPQTLLMWASTDPAVGMVIIRVAQDWNIAQLPPIGTFNSSATVGGQAYSLTLILGDGIPLPSVLPPLVADPYSGSDPALAALSPPDREYVEAFMRGRQSVVDYLTAANGSPPVTVPAGGQARRFFRVVEKALDSDGDGLFDWDELDPAQNTNPFSADTDGDGIADGSEPILAVSPRLVDRPTVDIEGRQHEALYHTCNTQSPGKPPVFSALRQARNGISPEFSLETHTPETVVEPYSLYEIWDTASPPEPYGNWFDPGGAVVNMIVGRRPGGSEAYSNDPTATATNIFEMFTAEWQVRLAASRPAPEELTRQFAVIRRQRSSSDDSAWVYTASEPVTLSIPKGRSFSSIHTVSRPTYLSPGSPSGYEERQRLMVPIELRRVDRDDPTRTWSKARVDGGPIYAGETTGDMVSWSVHGPLDWSGATYEWTAASSIPGVSINGPTGVNRTKWEISDALSRNDPDGRARLDWKPGRWLISCKVKFSPSKSITIQFPQEIGWRTEEMLVIGQIVETTALNPSSPAFPTSTRAVEYDFRRAVLYDISGLAPSFGIRDRAASGVEPFTAKIAELEFVYWGYMPHFMTPKGPFNDSSPWGFGNVLPSHRYWMIQHMLNVSTDEPVIGATFEAKRLPDIVKDKQFRVLHNFQGRFLMDSTGTKIDPTTVKKIVGIADKGVTKIKVGVEAGEFLPYWSNPRMVWQVKTEPSETNGWNDHLGVSSDNLTLSHYATARLGEKGRNVNWRLFGRDAPWIFSEILFDVQPDRSIKTRIRTSVDREWTRGGSTTGICTFNNLNLYRRIFDNGLDDNFVRQQLFGMDGMIPCFIDSGSTAWPGPPLSPSVP